MVKKLALVLTLFVFSVVYLWAASNPAQSGTVSCEQAGKEAAVLLEKGDAISLGNAKDLLGSVIDRESDCVPALVGYARALNAVGGFSITRDDYYTAFEYLARALVLDPKNVDAWWVMADLQRHIGQNDRALAVAKKAIELAPQNPWTHYTYGNILMNTDMKSAAKEFERALELKPGWEKAEFNLSAAYISTGDYNKAIAKLQEYLKSNPSDVKGLTNLGSIYVKMGKINEAEENFHKALSLDPRFGLALKGMGDVSAARKDNSKAIESYKLALVSMPDDAKLLALLGETQVKVGLIEDAITSYQQALGRDPNNMELIKILSDLKARQEKQKKP